jgi:hypothetical protein
MAAAVLWENGVLDVGWVVFIHQIAGAGIYHKPNHHQKINIGR